MMLASYCLTVATFLPLPQMSATKLIGTSLPTNALAASVGWLVKSVTGWAGTASSNLML